MPRKNRFFTFITALIPGVGYMYYGLMKKGFETALLFFLICQLSTTYYFLGNILFGILVPIWFFTFFDTYRISNKYLQGFELEDKCFIINNSEAIKNFINRHSNKKVLGYLLLFIGVFTLIDSIIMGIYVDSYFIKEILSILKLILVPIVITVLGINLIRNNHKTKDIDDVIIDEE